MTLFDAWQQCGNDQLMVREGRRCHHVARRETFIETCAAASRYQVTDILGTDWIIVAIDGAHYE